MELPKKITICKMICIFLQNLFSSRTKVITVVTLILSHLRISVVTLILSHLRMPISVRMPVTLRMQFMLKIPVTLGMPVTLRMPVTFRMRSDIEDPKVIIAFTSLFLFFTTIWYWETGVINSGYCEMQILRSRHQNNQQVILWHRVAEDCWWKLQRVDM